MTENLPGIVVRLVQFTDPHQFSDQDTLMRGVNTCQSFRHTLEYATPFIDQADAILLTGDIAQDENGTTYSDIVTTMAPLNKPVWCLPGNHDNPMEMSHLLDSPPFAYLGHHQAGNWEIVLLDTHQAGSAAGILGQSELARLDSRLSCTQAEHVLICLHHHPVSANSQWLDTVALIDADELFTIITSHNNVRGVCFGHIHQSIDMHINSVRFFSCPSTCTQFTPASDDFAVDQRPPGFRWINLHRDGHIESDTIWVTAKQNKTKQARYFRSKTE